MKKIWFKTYFYNENKEYKNYLVIMDKNLYNKCLLSLKYPTFKNTIDINTSDELNIMIKKIEQFVKIIPFNNKYHAWTTYKHYDEQEVLEYWKLEWFDIFEPTPLIFDIMISVIDIIYIINKLKK